MVGAGGEFGPHGLQSVLQTRTHERSVHTPQGRLEMRVREGPEVHGGASPARRPPPALLPSRSSGRLLGALPATGLLKSPAVS